MKRPWKFTQEEIRNWETLKDREGKTGKDKGNIEREKFENI